MATSELEKRRDIARKCMKCGFCQFFCPVYQEEFTESSVARGRQMFVRNVLDGKQELTPELADRFNRCTLCKTCETFCPSKAPTAELVIATRADIVAERGLDFKKRTVFRMFLKNRSLLAAGVKWASWFQWMTPETEGREGKVRHLPTFLEGLSKGRQIPSLPSKQLRQVLPEVISPPPGVATRMKVGFFSGCSTELLYPESGEKLAHLLASQGCEVHFPRAQGCCGTPVMTSGDFELARELADVNVAALGEYDVVVSGCASCSSTLKEYEHYLADNDERKEAYAAFKAKVRGVNEFFFGELDLDPSNLKLKEEYAGKKVTWHDPCHLARYQNVREQPRRLLQGVEGLEYVEMPNADRCCGMAGSFTLYYYETSKGIAEKKAEGIRATEADLVVTECPGCVMQITDIVAQREMPQKVIHFLELFE